MTDEPKVLEVELNYFRDNREEWVKLHPNKYVLVKGEKLIDTFNKPEDGVDEGARLFGNQPFLVRNVNDAIGTVNFVPVLSLGLI